MRTRLSGPHLSCFGILNGSCGARVKPRVTRRVLVEPLAQLLGWRLGEAEAVETLLGEEDGSQPLLIPDSIKPIGRLLAVPGEASLDHAAEGLHRRFAPVHSLIRIL